MVYIILSQSLWKYRLQYKFANSRKREDKHVPSVIQRKRKSISSSDPAPSKTLQSPPQWGMANYKPLRPSSEDDASICAHTSWMKQETKKKKPNHEHVNLAMSATFADRRQLITRGTSTVKEIQDVYPWLFDEEEVCFHYYSCFKFGDGLYFVEIKKNLL